MPCHAMLMYAQHTLTHKLLHGLNKEGERERERTAGIHHTTMISADAQGVSEFAKRSVEGERLLLQLPYCIHAYCMHAWRSADTASLSRCVVSAFKKISFHSRIPSASS